MFSFFKKKEYKLTPIQELLLALLRAQLWLKPVDDIVLPSAMDDWDELMDNAYKQTVVCFVSAACLRHKDVNNIPTDIREEMQAVIEENKKIHAKHNQILIELISKFEDQGLHPILLKGQGIAQMYPEPELRQCGDIDLYFLPEEYEAAKSFILTFDTESMAQKETYKHFGSSYKDIDVELHRHTCNFPNPFVNKRFQKWTEEEMCNPSSIDIAGKKILIPAPVYDLISVFAHFWHHFENGDVSLRQLCDIEMMYDYWRKNADLSLLEVELKRFDLLRYWYISSYLWDKHLFSFVENRTRYAKRAYLILSIIFADGGFKHEQITTKQNKSLVEKIIARYCRTFNWYIKYHSISGKQLFWRYAFREKIKLYLWIKSVVDN